MKTMRFLASKVALFLNPNEVDIVYVDDIRIWYDLE